MNYPNLLLPLCIALVGLASCRDTTSTVTPESGLTRNLYVDDDAEGLKWSYKGLRLDPYYANPLFQDSIDAAYKNGISLSPGLLRYYATRQQMRRLHTVELSKQSPRMKSAQGAVGEMGDGILIKNTHTRSFPNSEAQYADIVHQLDSLAALPPIPSPVK